MSSSTGEGTVCWGVPGDDGVLGVKGESDGIGNDGVTGTESGIVSLIFADELVTMTDSLSAQGEMLPSPFLLPLEGETEDSENPFWTVVVVWGTGEFPGNCISEGTWGNCCGVVCCIAANWWGEKKWGA